MDYTNLTQISKLIKNCDAFVPTPCILVNNNSTRHKKRAMHMCQLYIPHLFTSIYKNLFYFYIYFLLFIPVLYFSAMHMCQKLSFFKKCDVYVPNPRILLQKFNICFYISTMHICLHKT